MDSFRHLNKTTRSQPRGAAHAAGVAVLRDSYRGDAFAAEDSLGEHGLDRLGEAGQVAEQSSQPNAASPGASCAAIS